MNSPVKLAFVITELEVGGAERCLVNLATRIDRARFESAVYSLAARPRADEDSLVRELEAAGIAVHFLNLRSQWQLTSAVRKLAKLLRQQSPQLVQTFLYHANVVGTLAARRAGVAHVVTGVRTSDPRWSRAWIERLVTRNVDRIVCVSRQVAEYCAQRCGFAKHKLVVIPNGIDLSRFTGVAPLAGAALGLPPGRKAIVFVGRLDRQKGLDELLRVAPHIFRELAQHDLLLVGKGKQREELEDLAIRLAIRSRVHFAGWRADVPAILAAAEMLVLPSRWEGMPNVVLEAMASGKPVVAMKAEGVEDLLGEGARAQSVPLGEGDALAAAIIQLAQNPQLADELGKSNRARAAIEFSLTAMVSKYEQLYSELCE